VVSYIIPIICIKLFGSKRGDFLVTSALGSVRRFVIGCWRRPRCCSPHPNSFLTIRPHHTPVWGRAKPQDARESTILSRTATSKRPHSEPLLKRSAQKISTVSQSRLIKKRRMQRYLKIWLWAKLSLEKRYLCASGELESILIVRPSFFTDGIFIIFLCATSRSCFLTDGLRYAWRPRPDCDYWSISAPHARCGSHWSSTLYCCEKVWFRVAVVPFRAKLFAATFYLTTTFRCQTTLNIYCVTAAQAPR
jgi:hypothetical protein